MRRTIVTPGQWTLVIIVISLGIAGHDWAKDLAWWVEALVSLAMWVGLMSALRMRFEQPGEARVRRVISAANRQQRRFWRVARANARLERRRYGR